MNTFTNATTCTPAQPHQLLMTMMGSRAQLSAIALFESQAETTPHAPLVFCSCSLAILHIVHVCS